MQAAASGDSDGLLHLQRVAHQVCIFLLLVVHAGILVREVGVAQNGGAEGLAAVLGADAVEDLGERQRTGCASWRACPPAALIRIDPAPTVTLTGLVGLGLEIGGFPRDLLNTYIFPMTSCTDCRALDLSGRALPRAAGSPCASVRGTRRT